MSLIKDPSGSFYLESDQFNVDYEENSIKFVGESGEGATYTAGEGITISGNTISVDQEKIPTNTSMGEAISKCLSLDGGIMNADANIQANDAMNKATADTTYATKAEIANFITNDKLPTAATTSVAGIVKQAAAVTDASDNAVTTINELLVSLRNAGILASS